MSCNSVCCFTWASGRPLYIPLSKLARMLREPGASVFGTLHAETIGGPLERALSKTILASSGIIMIPKLGKAQSCYTPQLDVPTPQLAGTCNTNEKVMQCCPSACLAKAQLILVLLIAHFHKKDDDETQPICLKRKYEKYSVCPNQHAR